MSSAMKVKRLLALFRTTSLVGKQAIWVSDASFSLSLVLEESRLEWGRVFALCLVFVLATTSMDLSIGMASTTSIARRYFGRCSVSRSSNTVASLFALTLSCCPLPQVPVAVFRPDSKKSRPKERNKLASRIANLRRDRFDVSVNVPRTCSVLFLFMSRALFAVKSVCSPPRTRRLPVYSSSSIHFRELLPPPRPPPFAFCYPSCQPAPSCPAQYRLPRGRSVSRHRIHVSRNKTFWLTLFMPRSLEMFISKCQNYRCPRRRVARGNFSPLGGGLSI